MVYRRLISWISLFVAISFSSYAQTFSGNAKIERNLDYNQPGPVIFCDSYNSVTYCSDRLKVYSMKGTEAFSSKRDICGIKVNPSGWTIAVLTDTKSFSGITMINSFTGETVWERNKPKKEGIVCTSLCYSRDGRYFFYNENNTVFKIDVKTHALVSKVPISFVPSGLMQNPNGMQLIAYDKNNMTVLDYETLTPIRSIFIDAIRSVAFSDDGTMLAVACGGSGDGYINVLNTRTYQTQYSIYDVGAASSVSFHPEGKYLAVVTTDNSLVIQNIQSSNDRSVLVENGKGMSYVKFLKDGQGNIYLSYNIGRCLKYKKIGGISPHYTQLVQDMLTSRMAEWAQIREGETMYQYQKRVNDDTRMQQARLFEQEIATDLAYGMVENSAVTLSSYDDRTHTLELSFNNLPSVSLQVSKEEAQFFIDPVNLEFRDAKYGMNEDDTFELVYANVYNKATGKLYKYDNRENHSLAYLNIDDNFAPIELVRLSGEESAWLRSIKDEVLVSAKKGKIISDHTVVDVNTGVFVSTDSRGQKINNYKVCFNYQVEGSYSVEEDFPAGKYHLKDSHAALSVMEIVSKAFSSQFKQYLVPGKRVEVRVTGCADALPIRGYIPYDGVYGDYVDEPYFLNGQLNLLTVTPKNPIRKNEQLAYLRAASVSDYIKSNIDGLSSMMADYVVEVKLSDKTGGQYRRIEVEFVFVDAFTE